MPRWFCGLRFESAMAISPSRGTKRSPKSAVQSACPSAAALSGSVATSTFWRTVFTVTSASPVRRAVTSVVPQTTIGSTRPRPASSRAR